MSKSAKQISMDVLFQRVTARLQKEKLQFAVAGGLAASLYRSQKRTTDDLDFLIFSQDRVEERGVSIIRSFGLTPTIIHKADLEGGPLFAIKQKSTPPYMIVGRTSGQPEVIGLDFILPLMPWFSDALTRAQDNPIDFGYGKIPTLTVEDVLLSKFFAVQNNPRRFQDLDDIQSIFQAEQAGHPLDLPYLGGQLTRLDIVIPKEVRDFAPTVLHQISQSIELTRKRAARKRRFSR